MLLEDLIPFQNLENEVTEFKARIEIGLDTEKEDKALRWLKEIVAFANSNGGTIYVGVNDKSHALEPLSHQDFDKTVQSLYDTLRNRVEPEVEIHIKEIPVPDTKPTSYIMKINVPPSKTTPVFCHINGIPVAFIRKFGRSITATTEQLINLTIKNIRACYDEVPTDKKFSMTAFTTFKNMYEAVNNGESLTEKAMQSNLLIDEKSFITRGGYLFSDLSSSSLSLIKITQYSGINKGSSFIKDSIEFTGNLFDVIQKSISHIVNHTNSGFLKTDISRIDISAYPKRSLTEGLVNAFAHRNYFIDGSQISVDIFLDRLEITSPGSLLGNKLLRQEKDFSSINPKRRNQVICNAFVMLKMMEAKGPGLAKITEDYADQDEQHKPFINCDEKTFTLTLPDLTYEHGIIDQNNENPDIAWLEGSVVPYDKQILSHCYVSAKSLSEIASYIGLTPSTHLRKDIIGKLVEEGYLRQTKKSYSYYYQTNQSKVHLLNSPKIQFS